MKATELHTNEGGGPLGRWDRTLTFDPRAPNACRYTDTVELDGPGDADRLVLRAAALPLAPTALWRQLARVLA